MKKNKTPSSLRRGILKKAFLLSALCALFSCTESSLYTAYPYDEVKNCVGSRQALDVLSSPAPEQVCEFVCLVKKRADAGSSSTEVEVYVSDVCAPYPPLMDVSGTDPRCALALSAAKSKRTCLSLQDAGSN